MKFLCILAFLSLISFTIAQQEYDQIKQWRERLQFKEDYERLSELIEQVDVILAFLDSEQGKTLTSKQYEELLHEINAIEDEIKIITAAYKEEEL